MLPPEKEVANAVRHQDAARDTGRRSERALHEAAAPSAEQAASTCWGTLPPGTTGLLGIALLLAVASLLAVAGLLRVALRRGRMSPGGRNGTRAAAEDGPAEAAEEARIPLRLGASGLRLPDVFLELLDLVVSRAQRLVLDDHGLSHEVGRIGLCPDLIADQHFRFTVPLLARDRLHAIEEAGDQLAFVGGHRMSPKVAADRRRSEYGCLAGGSKSVDSRDERLHGNPKGRDSDGIGQSSRHHVRIEAEQRQRECRDGYDRHGAEHLVQCGATVHRSCRGMKQRRRLARDLAPRDQPIERVLQTARNAVGIFRARYDEAVSLPHLSAELQHRRCGMPVGVGIEDRQRAKPGVDRQCRARGCGGSGGAQQGAVGRCGSKAPRQP